MPYSVSSRSRLAGSARPHCVKCGTQMRFAQRSAGALYGRRYERWSFECPRCRNMQTYTMGSSDRRSQR
jgi:hypothetical protein